MIHLEADFDNGSLASFEVNEDRVLLKGRSNHHADKEEWKWVYFKASGIKGQDLVFEIPNSFEPGSSRLDRHKFWYSYDGQTWKEFEYHHHDREKKIFVFSKRSPFEEDLVHVAFSIPYPLSRIRRLVDRMKSAGVIQPSASCVKGLSLGLSPGGIDDIGRQTPRSPLYAFETKRLGNDGISTAVILGGVHPNEMPASFALEGFMEELFSGRHQGLLAKTRFVFYPMVNPDGRWAGYNRSTVQHVDRDANRFWKPELWEDMGDIGLIGNAILKDTGGQCDYFIDFHSWTNSVEHMGILSTDEGYHEHPLWKHYFESNPEIGLWSCGFDNWSSESFAHKFLNPSFCMTLETMFIPGQGVDDFKKVGSQLVHSFASVENQ